jgi:hypothetical protein
LFLTIPISSDFDFPKKQRFILRAGREQGEEVKIKGKKGAKTKLERN